MHKHAKSESRRYAGRVVASLVIAVSLAAGSLLLAVSHGHAYF